MEASIQANGKTGTRMAKVSTNKKVERCILEDSKMDGDMVEVYNTNKARSISLCIKMDI